MRRGGLVLALVAAAAVPAAAWAAFGAIVQTTGTTFAAYMVAAPGNLRCAGLTSLGSSRIEWDAVAPPAGQTVDYVVTLPSSRTTATTATFHQLPAISLTAGQYAVQTRISSGWLSQPSTITVTLAALGLLYLCRTP